jgi:hypothetical protein
MYRPRPRGTTPKSIPAILHQDTKGYRLTLAKSDRLEGRWILNTSSFVYFSPPQNINAKSAGGNIKVHLDASADKTKIAAARYFPFFFPSLGEIINDSWYMSQRP